MLEGLLRLFAARSFTQVLVDLVDIIIVAWVIYRALLVLRGTRAIQMAVGLGIVLLVYLGAKFFQLVTLLNLLSSLLSSIVLIVVVVFQNDIRRALIRVGGTAWFTGGREQQSRVIDEVVAAATELARHRMGALIAFEQDANVLEFVKSEGIQLDSVVTRELLVSLFVPESVNKLHDGAILIRDLKIARAGVFFPMPDTKILDAQLGSRHRAALGITEETDAVVVVVSEERGTISFCFSGNIVSNLDGQSLRHALLGLFGRSMRKKRPGAKKPAPAPAPTPVVRPAAPMAQSRAGIGHPATTPITAPPKAQPAGKVSTSTLMREGGRQESMPSMSDALTKSSSALIPQASIRGVDTSSGPASTARPASFVPPPLKRSSDETSGGAQPAPISRPQGTDGSGAGPSGPAPTPPAEES
jgi:diadenylate cyclase